jgi:hypothetical protein
VDSNTSDEVETKLSGNDGQTVLTQDDLASLKEEICAQFKAEISSTISELSIPSEYKTYTETIQAGMNEQIQEHNKEMKETMTAMRTMMLTMQKFVEASMPKRRRSNSNDSEQRNRDDSDRMSDDRNNDDNLSQRSDDSFGEVTNFPKPDDTASPTATRSPDENDFILQPSKRRAPLTKGESPAAKRTQSAPKGGRGGRGSAAGRVGPWRSLRTNLSNQFEPLASSEANLSSGES